MEEKVSAQPVMTVTYQVESFVVRQFDVDTMMGEGNDQFILWIQRR